MTELITDFADVNIPETKKQQAIIDIQKDPVKYSKFISKLKSMNNINLSSLHNAVDEMIMKKEYKDEIMFLIVPSYVRHDLTNELLNSEFKSHKFNRILSFIIMGFSKKPLYMNEIVNQIENSNLDDDKKEYIFSKILLPTPPRKGGKKEKPLTIKPKNPDDIFEDIWNARYNTEMNKLEENIKGLLSEVSEIEANIMMESFKINAFTFLMVLYFQKHLLIMHIVLSLNNGYIQNMSLMHLRIL